MSGGSSGAISFPDYLETEHRSLLSHAGDTTVDTDLVAIMNTMLGSSPFFGILAFNPDTNLTTMNTVVSDYLTSVLSLDHLTDYSAAMVAVATAIDTSFEEAYLTDPLPTVGIDTGDVDAEVAAFAAQQMDLINNTTLPQFKAGMLNINAIQTSSFVLGESLILAFNDRDVAKYSSELRYRMGTISIEANARIVSMREETKSKHFLTKNTSILEGTKNSLSAQQAKYTLWTGAVRNTIDAQRISIAAKKEELGEQMDLDENDAKWDVELFQYAGNFIASISGGVAPTQKRTNRAVSAIAGTLSGAATGASIGNTIDSGSGYGAAIGAVVGAGLGYYASTQ